MSAEGLSHSLRWVRAKLADKQQSAQTSPHLNRSRSWTLHPAPIGGKGTVLTIGFVSFGFDFRCIIIRAVNEVTPQEVNNRPQK